MEGLYRPADLFFSTLVDAEVLTPVRVGEHSILTILLLDDSKAAILLSDPQFKIFSPEDANGMAIKCGPQNLVVEVVSAPIPIAQVPDRPFGWLVVTKEGFSAVCSRPRPNAFNEPILVSLVDGRELANTHLHRDAVFGVRNWRLLTQPDGNLSPKVFFERV